MHAGRGVGGARQQRSRTESRADVGLRAALLAVARRAHDECRAADGVGATLMVAGRPVFMTSNAFTAAIDDLQYGVGEGPCITAAATGELVRSSAIRTSEPRWPRFTPGAQTLGLGSVLSAPLRAVEPAAGGATDLTVPGGTSTTGRPVVQDGGVDDLVTHGSLNLYARAPDAFDDASQADLIVRVAAAAAEELRGAHLHAMVDASAVALRTALQERGDVDVAVGVLMDRYAMTARHARILLAQLAQQDGVDQVTAARTLIRGGGSR